MKEAKQIHNEQIDIHYIFKLLTENKYIYIAALFISLSGAYLVNKYAERVYQIDTSIIINDDESSFSDATSNLLKGIGMGTSNVNYSNELLTLRSRPLILEAIKTLDFDISYFYHKGFRKDEVYKASPFVVFIDKDYPQLVNQPIHIKIDESGTFTLAVKLDKGWLYSYVSNRGTQEVSNLDIQIAGKFGVPVKSDFFSLKILLNENYNIKDYESEHFSFIINTLPSLANEYLGKLTVEPVDMESTVAAISIRSSVPQKEVDFLNSLTSTYLNRELNRKIFISNQTVSYIDNQLNVVKDSLKIAEEKLQQFRSSNKVVDISMQSGRVYEEMQDLEKEKANLLVRVKYYDYISEYFGKNEEYSDLITPAGMGIDDPLLNNMIEELITLNSEKVSFIENNQEKSPYLRKINIRIDNLRKMISENISYVQNTTNITLKDINSRINQLNIEIRKLPKAQRELFGIERKFNLNDAIYTFLLQRRAEAEIAKATYLSDAEVLEPATVGGPIAPNKRMNYIFALLLGILLPTSFVRIRDILRNTFSDRHDIEKLSILPILGRVYKNNKKIEAVVTNFPKSHLAECFRMLRSNLNYFLPNSDSSNIIVITSLISQEGKSFISLNLATSLANAHHKTVLLGFDLRKPKLYDRMGVVENKGLSGYLSNQVSLDDIIQTSNVKNLDIIYAGNVPPNPSELITSGRTDELFELLKERYDKILVDTAPIGIVSETYDLIEKADLKILVMRLKHTPKKEVLALIEEMKNKNLMNTSLVINDIPLMKKTRYGYGYYEQT